MTLQELIDALKEKVESMETLLNDNPEGLSEEDAEKYDALEDEVNKLEAQIKRKKAIEERKEAFQGQGRRTESPVPQQQSVPAQARDHEREAMGDFENLGEFAMAVFGSTTSGDVDDRLRVLGASPSNPHRETGSTDGYMVPPAMSNRLFELVFQDDDLLSQVHSEPTDSNSVMMLADETTPWGAAGIKAYWGSEAGQLKRSRLETEGKQVNLFKLHAFVEATDEILSDTSRLNSRLQQQAPKALRWELTESIINGNGVGKPLGFMNANSKIAIAKESGQAAATITIDNIIKMFARSMNPGGSNWRVNQDCLPQLMRLKFEDNSPAWMSAAQGAKDAPGGFLMGRPIRFSDHCETIGTEGDIQFVDPMGYYMPQKNGIKFSSSIHLMFDFDTECFKWTIRAGGRPYLSKPVTPYKGSSTRSHFLTLANRN